MTSPTGTTNAWHPRIHPLHSVRVRMALIAVLVTATTIAIAGWLLVHAVEDTQLGQLRDDVNADLDEVVARLQAGDDPQDVVDAAPTPIEVTDHDGRVVASTPDIPQKGGAVRPRPGDGAGPDVDTQNGPPLRAAIAPEETVTRTAHTPTGELTVSGNVPVDQVARSVDALRHALQVGLPALVALVAALAWVLVGRALRPVDAIRAEVDEITGSTTHRRVPEPSTDDEIGRLARTMNAMLARLDATTTRQRQFIADASHELRSPVTAIRAALEVARHKGNHANWHAVADTALAHESRLETLLDDLLTLAAHDEDGTATRPPIPVNLTKLTDTEAQRPRPVPVYVTHPPTTGEPLEITGDPDQLARMITNLLDNAARYATTAIQISLASQNDTVRLIIDDDGPGIPPHDRERIFERFTRLDNGRSRHEGGTGLGLALVHAIATYHHGHVWVDDSPTGGARFIVEVPTRTTTPTPTPHP
jgi:signal transduction histidine kinase